MIIRHDIDADIKKALDMAEFEKERGVRVAYFVLVSNGFYNIFTKENEEMLKEICHYGHEIGLPFDEMKYGIEDDLIQCMEKENELLEIYIERGIQDSDNFHVSPFQADIRSKLLYKEWRGY